MCAVEDGGLLHAGSVTYFCFLVRHFLRREFIMLAGPGAVFKQVKP